MPDFIVIAGPNGAGKSSFSNLLSPVNTQIFDPDKERLKISRSYPDISDEAIEDELTREYERQEAGAIANLVGFTVETNFRNQFLAEKALHFKSLGYTTTVIFMMLPSLETSIERVNLRVKRNGHYVDLESVRTNYEMSWKTLKDTLSNFDNVVLMNGAKLAEVMPPETLLISKSGKLTQINKNLAEWCIDLVNEVQNLMADYWSEK
jgi:predicted ABC-type ATPase